MLCWMSLVRLKGICLSASHQHNLRFLMALAFGQGYSKPVLQKQPLQTTKKTVTKWPDQKQSNLQFSHLTTRRQTVWPQWPLLPNYSSARPNIASLRNSKMRTCGIFLLRVMAGPRLLQHLYGMFQSLSRVPESMERRTQCSWTNNLSSDSVRKLVR